MRVINVFVVVLLLLMLVMLVFDVCVVHSSYYGIEVCVSEYMLGICAVSYDSTCDECVSNKNIDDMIGCVYVNHDDGYALYSIGGDRCGVVVR